MSMQIRYTGSFLSRHGVTWRCDILQESSTPFEVGELTFPASSPLVIEWPETAKHDTICASNATLTIESPGDRTYIDLYTIKAGDVRLDVYRNNVLYWSGTLDTEFYEEPYSRARNYDVRLTFADFGILKRNKYDLSGRQSLSALISAALSRTKTSYGQVAAESSLRRPLATSEPLDLAKLAVASDNWFDEDEKASTWYEVLEGILQPLGLRIIQKAGAFHIHDLDTIYGKTVREIAWSSDDSRLGTDSVYNNITVTFSPYAKADIQDGELDYGDTYGEEWTNTGNTQATVKYKGGSVPEGKVAPECWSYYPNYDEELPKEDRVIDFTIFRSTNDELCKGVAQVGAANAYFRMCPMAGGSDDAGIIGGFYTGGHGDLKSGRPVLVGLSPEQHPQGAVALKTHSTYIPYMGMTGDHYLRIAMDLLFDTRYNPYEEADEGNEKGNTEMLKKSANFLRVPVAVELHAANGQTYHWTNAQIVVNGAAASSIRATLGAWEPGAAQFGEAWLTYYDTADQMGTTPCLGWGTNHQSFGCPLLVSGSLFYIDADENMRRWWKSEAFMKAPDGQYIPYPPAEGQLEITVFNGVYATKFGNSFAMSDFSGFDKIRWQMYKVPVVTVVNADLRLSDAEESDVEYSGELNEDAQEQLSIDTIVGTLEEICPTARGSLMDATDGSQLRYMYKPSLNVFDHPEQLLIGTLYSQHASRHTKLSGEVELDPQAPGVYSDAAQPAGRKFMLMGESQDVIEDCADATFIELTPSEYIGKE